MTNPKVFISHASEDKVRFVLGFATKLRENGIDAWYDEWEMFPGDSLVDKLFEEGLKEAKAVIIVLSKFSVGKPWVREELNAGFVKRVNSGSKLIPVIIENCEVPACLESTIWEKVNDLNYYNDEFDRIMHSILGTTDKPKLGELPEYKKDKIVIIGDLSEIDSLVFKTSCELMLATNRTDVYTKDLFERLNNKGVSKEKILESLDVLAEEYYIDKGKELGELNYFIINHHSFNQYALKFFPEFEKIYKDVVFFIVNRDRVTSEEIHLHFKISIVLVDHLLEDLNNQNLITLIKNLGGSIVQSYSPKLKRSLE